MSLYHEAAAILASPSEGGSLKSRVFSSKQKLKSPPNQLYALVFETTKWSPVLKELTPVLSLLLVHDLLLSKRGIALAQNHGLRASVERHKGRLKSELTRARLRRQAASLDVLAAQVQQATAGDEAPCPRWVRINALKSSVQEQLETTFAGYTRAMTVVDVMSKTDGRHIFLDTHVPDLVAVTPGTDLTKTEAYASGKIVLQDKASCFPAYLLDPRSEDGDVVDACAAPGNKTSHLAAILDARRTSGPQTVFAFEKDARRAQTLHERVRAAGCNKMTRIGFAQDFLLVDPHDDRYCNVGALLLDPSCSGSGIIGRDWMPSLCLPDARQAVVGKKRKRKTGDEEGKRVKVKQEEKESHEADVAARLEALASFQLTLLLHAFRFPAAKKVTYSTCSIYAEENERVVMAALKSDVARRRRWRLLTRDEQVRGMREWPVRGLLEECEADSTIADGCIRCHKDDGRGTMGFFVAAFKRDDQGEAGDDEGPYVRDEGGRIVRDVLGMPTVRSTGAVVRLQGSGEGEEKGEGEDDDDDEATEEEEEEEEEDEDEEDDDDDDRAGDQLDQGSTPDEWNGIGD
ncbi:hypothetical protein CDD80_5609 [Ophiocordyceps camponoti-rufipedis]|uniref:SAM-dependent MTase RsmB/NOP-type domain-containing protein n=1 Tax=Ophiocordyceps camponoti-rufipedis TaxID=2004952 RepID=A0A2C5YVC3_9HYPO|nr:hypothetical protein CDD80_5609 [Ophiocordyceps camponoti-rufipedis]